MGRDKASELQTCLRHNTALMNRISQMENEIERLEARIKWLEMDEVEQVRLALRGNCG